MKLAAPAWMLATAFVASGCASALKPLDAQAVTAAQGASAEPQDPEALLSRIRKLLREVEAEGSAERRKQLVVEAVQLGQICDSKAPADPRCDYGLALALGAQARERPKTAHDGLPRMVERLERAAKSDPALDHGGPTRVLSLVLVRAPGWPTGPGDPETGLEEAQKAVKLDDAYAPNWLALAEAADATGDEETRKKAAEKAASLAEGARAAGEPDAEKWLKDALALRDK